MDDLDALARDFGFGPRGKSNPMRSSSSQPDRRSPGSNSNYSSSNNYGNSGDGSKYAAMDGFDYDTVFNSTEKPDNAGGGGSSSRASSFHVYDKPVYDNDGGDMFDGLPGVKSKSGVRFEDDVFVSKSRHENSGFDDLLGNLGSSERGGESNKSRSARSGTSAKGFDDLLAGFGSGGSASSNNRQLPERNSGSVPYGGSKHESVLDDPFVVLGSSSAHASFSSSVYTDPLEEIGKSRSARAEVSSGGGGGTFDDLDPLNSFGKPIDSFSPGRERKREDGSPSRSTTPQSATNRKLNENSSFRNSESNMEKKIPLDKFQEPPLFAAPNVSTDFQKSFGKNASSPEFYETDSEVDMSPTSEQEQHCDDIWLSVSEIPLFTQPTAAPPPSRPPPPKPRQSSRPGVGSFSSGSRKKGYEFSSPKSYSQYSQDSMPSRSTAKGPPVTQLDKLEDFAQGGPQHIFDESANLHSSEDTNAFSAAAASAAAMKKVMDKAEAKFRHAKEVREREYAKASRNKEPDRQDREFWETERKQKEEEERAERRLERERERSREIEREKGRQAVERATREARERAVTGAHERATAEARVKSERAAVEKANAEARARAERVAVQRAQAEARERAAAEAKDRAERAAAAESRDKAAALRAGAESRRRSERAAVERATAEARERAAVEARERASTAAKVNQPRTEDDLESFFSMGRASSAPRPRSNPTNPFFDQQFQNQGGFQGAQKTSASSGPPPNMMKASSTTNIVDDLSSIFGAAPSSGEFQEVEGETEGRRRARLDRNQRTQERAAKALAEKNQRDLQAQRDQEERHRISETLDFEIKRWAAGKEGNLRALLSTLQYVLWPECGWQPVSLTDLIAGASVKKVYRKATLCIHPDKVQQKGATLQQKYIAEKVFDLLKEAWNKFNSEELF